MPERYLWNASVCSKYVRTFQTTWYADMPITWKEWEIAFEVTSLQHESTAKAQIKMYFLEVSLKELGINSISSRFFALRATFMHVPQD